MRALGDPDPPLSREDSRPRDLHRQLCDLHREGRRAGVSREELALPRPEHKETYGRYKSELQHGSPSEDEERNYLACLGKVIVRRLGQRDGQGYHGQDDGQVGRPPELSRDGHGADDPDELPHQYRGEEEAGNAGGRAQNVEEEPSEDYRSVDQPGDRRLETSHPEADPGSYFNHAHRRGNLNT